MPQQQNDSKFSFTLYSIKVKFFVVKLGLLETFFFNKRTNSSLPIVSSSKATSSSSLYAIANDDLFSRYFQRGIFSENCRVVAVAMLLNMPRRVKRDAGLASAFTRMCRPRRHLPSWCLRSLITCGRSLSYQLYPIQILKTEKNSLHMKYIVCSRMRQDYYNSLAPAVQTLDNAIQSSTVELRNMTGILNNYSPRWSREAAR